MKKCSKCGEIKPVTEFHKHSKIKSGLRPSCKACILAQNKEWKEANPERYRDGIAQWWRDHPEKQKAKDQRRREAGYWQRYNVENRERLSAKGKADYLVNKAKRRKQMAAWMEANRASMKAYSSRWKRENLDKIRVYNHTRRAAKEAAGGSHTEAEAIEILARQGHRCANPGCGADLFKVKTHLDHIVPLSRGGSNDAANLQWLCKPCNLSKWTYTMQEWLDGNSLAWCK